MELDGQLIEFLHTRSIYNMQFAMDLLSLLKLYLGKYVNEYSKEYNCKFYSSLTENFIICVVLRLNYVTIRVIYKLRKLSLVIFSDIAMPHFRIITPEEKEDIMDKYHDNPVNFELSVIYSGIEISNSEEKNIEWLFATTPVKSANSLIDLIQ